MTAQQPPATTTRRRVVATGAHLAWSTPVILAASSLPAHGVAVSGAAVIATGEPSFTIPPSHVRVSTVMRNTGTVAPASMDVVVQIIPIQGGITNEKPEVQGTEYAFVGDGPTINSDGSQTLTFRKLDPQIAPNTFATLRFDFVATPDAVTGFKQGTVTVSPSVPPPGAASPNGNDYLSTFGG